MSQSSSTEFHQPRQSRARSERPTSDRSAKLKLMVVDDEPDNLDLLYRTFRRSFQVYKATSGLDALELLEQVGEMAVIISDQRMPKMNGTEFLSRTVEPYPDTIRIVLTGYTDVEDLVEAINSGKVFKYITKPWNPEELKQVVHQAGETYQVLKQRTNELNWALRQESLFNAVMTAIRESLDYRSMLQTIVETLGHTFAASQATLFPVEGDRLLAQSWHYAATPNEPDLVVNPKIQTTAIAERTLQLHSLEDADPPALQLAVPLIYQQELLALLVLHRNDQSVTWTESDIDLIRAVADQTALALSQAKLYQRIQEQTEQMQAELAVARQIQMNLLRQSWPDFAEVYVQARCYPARAVGGDFFEVFVHPQGDIWLAVGDVSGKGVPAALFMASALSVLRRELSQEISPEPHIVMSNLNSSLSDDLVGNNCFITMVLARYTPSTQELAYANAGHIYPMLWQHGRADASLRSSQPEYLKVRGVPLGILPIWKANSGLVNMTAGQVILLASDGITEATLLSAPDATADGSSTLPANPPMLQQEGLWEVLVKEPSPFELESVLSSIQALTCGQDDDQTILSLEVL